MGTTSQLGEEDLHDGVLYQGTSLLAPKEPSKLGRALAPAGCFFGPLAYLNELFRSQSRRRSNAPQPPLVIQTAIATVKLRAESFDVNRSLANEAANYSIFK
jgi:hypothetical protein